MTFSSPMVFTTVATGWPFSTVSFTATCHSLNWYPSSTFVGTSPVPTGSGGSLPTTAKLWSTMASSMDMPSFMSFCVALTMPVLDAGITSFTPSALVTVATGSPSSTRSPSWTCHLWKVMPAGAFVGVSPGATFKGGSFPTVARLWSCIESSMLMPSCKWSWMAVTTPPFTATTSCSSPLAFFTTAIGSLAFTESPFLTKYFTKVAPSGASVAVSPAGPVWTGSAGILPMDAMLRSSTFSTGSPGFSFSCLAVTKPSLGEVITLVLPSLSVTVAMGSPFLTTSPTSAFHSLKVEPSSTVVGALPGPLARGSSCGSATTTRALSSSLMSIFSSFLSLVWVAMTVPSYGDLYMWMLPSFLFVLQRMVPFFTAVPGAMNHSWKVSLASASTGFCIGGSSGRSGSGGTKPVCTVTAQSSEGRATKVKKRGPSPGDAARVTRSSVTLLNMSETARFFCCCVKNMGSVGLSWPVPKVDDMNCVMSPCFLTCTSVCDVRWYLSKLWVVTLSLEVCVMPWSRSKNVMASSLMFSCFFDATSYILNLSLIEEPDWMLMLPYFPCMPFLLEENGV
mmetsp:Transcript_72687/g.206292  ORF Transcript_72687/g.206292 Transcript_72687/m.206292 type:complete len:565 (+) Transcript_72687:1077-2771(+)